VSTIKDIQLRNHYNHIIKCHKDWWLYPPLGKVRGFLGSGPIMFVGERPSTGHFPSKRDLILYRLLEKNKVFGSHLTDIIKCRGKVEAPYPEDLKPDRECFEKELYIIKPKMIVAFGNKVHDLLQFYLAGRGIKLLRIPHYAVSRWGMKRKRGFEKQLRKVVDEYRSLKG
jgi:uracil-DNA glycosylase